LTEEELPRLKPEQVRARVEQVKIVRKQAVLEEMAAETAAERDKVKRTEQAAQAKIGSAATADLAAAQARQRRLAALPPLLRDAEGIRQGIIFSEIIGPPLALR
jgi:hypothetical protein